MASRGVQYLDMQPFLERVCDQMAVGELLHDESFSLFESMTAIEIGDPKMDLALRRHQDVGTPEELIAAGHAPIELSAPQLLGLMDQLMVMETAWHCGAMLPQTVYTSLYMLQIDRLAGHPVLQAFCLAIRSACTMVRDLIISGQVCEDEDFSIYIFGVTLDPPGPAAPKASLQALREMQDYLEQQVRAGSGGSSGAGGGDGRGSGKKPARGSAAGLSLEATKAMLARIRFRRFFHQALQHLTRSTRADVDQARNFCEQAMDELQRMRDSCHLALAAEHPGFIPEINRKHMGLVPPRPVKAPSREGMIDHFSALMAALAGVCRSLLVVTSWDELGGVLVPFAAQPSSPITRSVMHLLLSSPIRDAAHAQAVAGAAGRASKGSQGSSSPTASKGSGGGGSPSRGSPAGGWAGAGAGAGAGGGGGPEAPSAAPRGDAQLPAWCPGPRMVCGEFGWELGALPGTDVELFVEQCAIAMQGWCHTMCLNRARQRRRLRRLLEDWRNMFDHGLNADTSADLASWMTQRGWHWMPLDETGEDPQGPVATWVEREACRSMVAHLMQGFQLDLYQPHEYRAVYWYCDYLLGTQQQTTKFLFAARPPPAAAAPAAQQAQQRPRPAGRHGGASRRHKDGGGGGGQQAPLAEEAMVAEQKKTLEFMTLEIERMMCQGMMKMATGLTMLGCIPEPEAPFNAEEQRFAQRFAAFQLLARPQPLCYGHFQQSMQTAGLSADAFFALAFENFFKAQHGAAALLQGPTNRLLTPDQVNHLGGLKRVAAQNSMALKIMTAAARKEAEQAQQPQQQQPKQIEVQQPTDQGQQPPPPPQQQGQPPGGAEAEQPAEQQQPLEAQQQQQQGSEQQQQEQQQGSEQQQQEQQQGSEQQQQEQQQGSEQQQQQQGKAVTRPARQSPFSVSWDFKPSLQSSVAMFYPVIALRSAAAPAAAAAAAAVSGAGRGS